LTEIQKELYGPPAKAKPKPKIISNAEKTQAAIKKFALTPPEIKKAELDQMLDELEKRISGRST